MLAILAPGQGAQTPGFMQPWFDHFESIGVGDFSNSLATHWSEIAGVDLRHLGCTADADEIRDTANAQPLLLFGALTGAGAIFAGDTSDVSLVAGHSVGEIAAVTFAQLIDPDQAFALVSARGREMAKAAEGSGTGMSAVLGGDREVVVTHLASLGLTAANENGGGQIVAAGALTALATLAENPPAGARVRPLQVSGAFHTAVMQPAVEEVRKVAAGLALQDPQLQILSNKDGALVADKSELMNRIVGQIAGPVRWDLCMQSMADMGITGVIELPPAGTLCGLIKRAQPTIETFALKAPSDLEAAWEFIAQHGGK